MINRINLLNRHNPTLTSIDTSSPLSVGNGELGFTADITGMQTLYEKYEKNNIPLCTMSQWGWHTEPANNEKKCYTLDDVEMTEYIYNGRKVNYAVKCKEGNEHIYHWLRTNPHRLNLARIGLTLNKEEIKPSHIKNIHQELHLYEGMLVSEFMINETWCKVKTFCHQKKDILMFCVESPLLNDGLEVQVSFPYGNSDISGSNWKSSDKHSTTEISREDNALLLERVLDNDNYYVKIKADTPINLTKTEEHSYVIKSSHNVLTFAVAFSNVRDFSSYSVNQLVEESKKDWNGFWNRTGVVDLHKSKDARAIELERRIVLSQYLLAIQSGGSLPPQETGLTCNSWYGKFHLEMHIWHSLYMPLWNVSDLLERSLKWYVDILPKARENAKRNGYRGARWPKMVSYEGIDSPSPIATLLIWQQPHIIYMLEMIYHSKKDKVFIEKYWEIIKETADFMCDFVVLNEKTQKYDLVAPLIPAQEEHEPMDSYNPTYELEYWRFGLTLAINWAKRMKADCSFWEKIKENLADLPLKDGLYLAHENCTHTFERFNRDHPSMLLAFGLIPSDRVDKDCMKNTLKKVIECWDFSTMWGWDFALMAMTAVRLGEPEMAIDILLKDTPKNSYVISGNNNQILRKDLPLYLPGNGSLLLCMALMLAGTNENEKLLGFPDNDMWDVEFENIMNMPM